MKYVAAVAAAAVSVLPHMRLARMERRLDALTAGLGGGENDGEGERADK